MSIVGVPGSTVKDMCPAACGTCATTTTTTTVLPFVVPASACTYRVSATVTEKQAYFACLRNSCEDTLDTVVTTLSGGDETSCITAVAGLWTCDADISMSIVGVAGSTVKDMCPAACGTCATTTTTTVLPFVVPASACTYRVSATVAEKQAYFACLRSSCEDTLDTVLTSLSGGDETSCSTAVAGGWTCNVDISMSIVDVPGSTVKDMCPATCGMCSTSSNSASTVTATTTQPVTTTTLPTSACAYPRADSASVADKQVYFACLRASCEDTLEAVVASLSGGDETSCSAAVAGRWTCGADISMTFIGVPGSTVQDMCPATCGTCAASTTVRATASTVVASISGDLLLTLDKAPGADWMEDGKVEEALRHGIAAGVRGVAPSMVTILNVTLGRRLNLRDPASIKLKPLQVAVDYEISMPRTDSEQVNVTIVQGAGSEILAGFNAALSDANIPLAATSISISEPIITIIAVDGTTTKNASEFTAAANTPSGILALLVPVALWLSSV